MGGASYSIGTEIETVDNGRGSSIRSLGFEAREKVTNDCCRSTQPEHAFFSFSLNPQPALLSTTDR